MGKKTLENECKNCMFKKMVKDYTGDYVLTNKDSDITNDLLIDISDGCAKNCYLKKFISDHYNKRLILQLKNMYDEKWLMSQKAGYEVDLNDAAIEWVASGAAKAFADLYDKAQLEGVKLHHSEFFLSIQERLNRLA